MGKVAERYLHNNSRPITAKMSKIVSKLSYKAKIYLVSNVKGELVQVKNVSIKIWKK